MARIKIPSATADAFLRNLYAAALTDQLAAKNRSLPVPETPADLWRLVRDVFDVDVPRIRSADDLCVEHSAPFDAFASAYYRREVDGGLFTGRDEAVSTWEGSRGLAGKTFLLALLGVTEQVTYGAAVSLLGGSLDQSAKAHEYTTETFWEATRAPRHLIIGDLTKRTVRLRNGGRERVLAASTRQARGGHDPRLRLDEIDEMTSKVWNAVLGQPMTQNGVSPQVVMSSTHHYPDGTMTEAKKRAAERGWRSRRWCYRENRTRTLDEAVAWGGETIPAGTVIGWATEQDIADARDRVTAEMWRVEYELGEPSSEGRVLYAGVSEATFSKSYADQFADHPDYDRTLRGFAGAAHRELVFEEPVVEGTYATGTDWAKDRDWTIIATIRIDVKPNRLVAYLRTGRRPYPQMQELHDDRVRRYRGQSAYDMGGVGRGVGDYLETASEGVDLIGRVRSEILGGYLAWLEHGGLIAPYIEHAESEHRYATFNDVYGRQDQGHLPDTIAALALAKYAAGHDSRFPYDESDFDHETSASSRDDELRRRQRDHARNRDEETF